MKKTMFAVMMAAVMMIGTATAQPQRPDGEKREKPTPEQMAKFRTERMAKELNLTQEQQQQVYDYTLTRINEASKKAEAARTDMEAARKSNAEKMQKILTPEQYQKWEEMQKRQAEMGRARGQQGVWHGPRPQAAPDHKGAHGPKHHGKGPKPGNKAEFGKRAKAAGEAANE